MSVPATSLPPKKKKPNQNFGQNFRNTGAFGQSGTDLITGLGFNNNDFTSQFNLSQDSTPQEFQLALQNARKGKNNIADPSADPFAFSDLPTVGQEGGIGQGLRNIGNQAAGQGQGFSGASGANLEGLLGNLGGKGESLFGQSGQSNQLSLNAQQLAENPELNAQGNQFFKSREDSRRSQVDNLFGKGSREQELLGKNLANDIANLDELGVSGSSEASTISNLLGDFQGRRANAQIQADELSRNERLGERQDIRGAGLNIAGLRSGESLGRQQIGSGLLGQQSQTAQGLGSIGNDLQKLGLTGLDASLTQEGNAREREASLQQGEAAFNTNLQQQYIDNILRNKTFKSQKEMEDFLRGQL